MIQEKILKEIADQYRKPIQHSNALPCDYVLYNGKYKVKELIYFGDNGFVYKGEDCYRKKAVVIKEFFPQGEIEYNNQLLRLGRHNSMAIELLNFSPKAYEIYMSLIKRFFLEGERLRELSTSPYVVTVRDCFETNNTGYIVLDYVPYPTLSEVMASAVSVSSEDVKDMYMLLLQSVEMIHEAGIIHRDIKPSNLYVLPDRVLIGDFGIAKTEEDINRTGTIAYSRNYASPEQIQGNELQGTWSDVYSLGKIMQYMVMQLGYQKSQQIQGAERAYEIGLEEMDNALNRQVIMDLIAKACKEPVKQRLQSIREIYLLMEHQKKRKWRPIALSGAVVLGMALMLVLLWIRDYRRDTEDLDRQQTNSPHVTETGVTEADVVERDGASDPLDEEKASLEPLEQVEDTKPVKEQETEVVQEQESATAVEQEVEQAQVAFLTPMNMAYEFQEQKLIEWTNPHGFEGYVYTITDLATWQLKVTQFYALGSSLDVGDLGLNPSTYRLYLYVNDPDGKFSYMQYMDFVIQEPDQTMEAVQGPELDFYSYTQSGDKVIAWEQAQETGYHVTMVDRHGSVVVGELDVNTPELDLDNISNQIGYYRLIIQAKKEQKISNYRSMDVSIVDDSTPRMATMNVADNEYIPYEGEKILEWGHMDQPTTIYLTLNHVVSGETIKKELDGKTKKIDLNTLGLQVGTYELILMYKSTQGMAPYRRIHFHVLAPVASE